MKKIKVGIVGTGNAAEMHYLAAKSLKNVELVSIYGKNTKRLLKRSKEWSLKIYNNVFNMTKKEQLDLIIVCNQNNLHADSALQALKAGANILIEKPIDANFLKAKKLIQFSQKQKKKIAVVMQKRFDKANNILKKIIHSNKYGRLIFINADIFMNRKESYFKSREWLTNKESIGGGILLHHGIHILDQIIYIINDKITQYNLWTSNRIRKFDFEDTCGGWMKFKKGFILNFNATVCAAPPLQNRIEIYLEKRKITYENGVISMNSYSGKYGMENYLKFKNTERGTYLDVWKNIIYSIQHNKKPVTDASSVIISDEIIRSLYKNSSRK